MTRDQIEPYPGPRPFTVDDAGYFCGREREIADLLSLLAGYRLILLYGLSGVGKSSVVIAGLRPRLQPIAGKEPPADRAIVIPAKLRGIKVLVGRVTGVRSHEYPAGDGHTNIYVHSLLASINMQQGGVDGALPTRPPATLSTHLCGPPVEPSSSEDSGGSEGSGKSPAVLLIVDQFEEVLTAYPDRWQEREEFFRQLGDLLAKHPRVRVLLVAREEFVPALERYGDYLPDALRIRYRLERLRPHEATAAIVGPADKAEQSVEGAHDDAADGCRAAARFLKENVDTLLKNLQQTPLQLPNGETTPITGEFIEPLQLQIVCQSLWARESRQALPARRRDLRLSTDVEEVLSNFYATAIERASRFYIKSKYAPAIARIALGMHDVRQRLLAAVGLPSRLHWWTTHELMTPMGTRSQVYLDATSKTAAGLPQGLIEALEKERLIRSDSRGGTTWYELTHDRFIYAIDALDRTRRKRLTRVAAIAAAAFLLIGASAAWWVVGYVTRANEQVEVADDKREKAESALKTQEDAERARAESAARYVAEGLKLASSYDPSADELLRRAQSEDALAGLKAMNAARAVETEAGAHAARARYLRALRLDDQGAAANPELPAAVCATPVTVVGASESRAAAQDELQRFRNRGFKVSDLSEPVGTQRKVYVEQFVSCARAADLVALVNKEFRTGAFVENEFRACGGCPNLPQSFRKPSVGDRGAAAAALAGYRVGIYYAVEDAALAAHAKQLQAGMVRAGFKGAVLLYPKPTATLNALVPAQFDQVRYDEPDEIEAVEAMLELLKVADPEHRFGKVRSWSGTPGFLSIFLAASQ